MITPMSHLTLLARREDQGALLQALHRFGRMHLAATPVDGDEYQGLRDNLQTVDRVLHRLEGLAEREGDCPDAVDAVLEDVIVCESRIKELEGLDQHLHREERLWEPFGDLDGACLAALRAAGLSLKFFRGPEEDLPELPNNGIWLRGEGEYLLAVCLGEVPDSALTPLVMPVRTPATIRKRRVKLNAAVTRLEERLKTLRQARARLHHHRRGLEEHLSFAAARAGVEKEGALCWISGFLPTSAVPAVEAFIQNEGLACQIRDVEPDDAVPTRLENGALIDWIRPVLEFLGVTPGYREVDVSAFFFIFLSLFSAMIVGDAGYGALLLGGVLGLTCCKPSFRGPFANLLMLMGGATIVWGLLSGNVFGLEVGLFRIEALTRMEDLMQFCFLLGALHLSLAHIWGIWRKRRELRALSELGWVGLTWTMYATANTMVLGKAFPAFMLPVAVASVVLVLLFMTPWRELKTDWMDHVMLPLSLVNGFVDVVSYVRLYAVGMATLALAQSFNEMTMGGAGERHLLVTAAMVLVLVLGHALNFILAGMGVMVHGIRLNTLEFASHLGMTWSGIPYQPFGLSEQNTDKPLNTGDDHGSH